MKAFIFDPLWNQLVDDSLLARLSDASITVIVETAVKPLADTPALFEGNEERLLCLNPDYVNWNLKDEDYEKIPNLKAILIASTGFEWVEQNAANRRNIPICNVLNFSTQAVAEWAIMMMSALARQTPRLIKDGFPLDFDKDFMSYRGVQLRGKTAGIVGLGHIGSAIAEACQGLGMKVVYWSRSSSNESYQKVSIQDLLATADVVFPALAKNAETQKLVDDELTKTLKKTAILVDVTLSLFDQEIVLDMVTTGELFGYGFEAKPGQFKDFSGNVWAAPAYAWATYESMYNSEAKLVENIINAAHGQFPNRVNL